MRFREQLFLKKQHDASSCTKTSKKKDLLIYLEICSLYDQKRKSCPYELSMKQFESYRTKNCYSEKSFSQNCSPQQQLVSSSYQRTQPLVKILTNTYLRSEFKAQPLSKMDTCAFLHEAMNWYKKLKTLLTILQRSQFILFCAWKLILHRIVVLGSRKRFRLITWCTSLIRRIS